MEEGVQVFIVDQPDVEAARSRVVEALRVMLDWARQEPFPVAVVEGTGTVVTLDYERVRCVLVLEPAGPVAALSPREMQIARLVARGATTGAIATTLGISCWTVSSHLRRCFAKLRVSTRAEMVNALFAVPQVLHCRHEAPAVLADGVA